MREEATFRCRWKRTTAGYSLWVPGYPSIKLEASDLSAGAKAITDLLLEHGVATMAVLELSPRPPVAEAFRKFAQPELYLIVGDAPCYSSSVDSTMLLTGSLCERCRCVSGIRNDTALSLDCSVTGDGGFTYDKGRTYSFFSGEFLNQLTGGERACLQFREIHKGGRRSFFELVGPSGVPTTAVEGLQHSGWFCSGCGRRTFGYFIHNMPIRSFVSRATLPTPLPPLFTVAEDSSLKLCVTAARWDELREMGHSRGVISHLLGVVDPTDEIAPILPELMDARRNS